VFAVTRVSVFLFFLLTNTALGLQSTTTLHLNILDPDSRLVSTSTARLRTNGRIVKEIKSKNGQEIVFARIEPGKYVLEVAANGFKPQSQSIEIKSGRNDLTLTLEIAEIVEEVKVQLSAQEKATNGAFTNFLTTEQIVALPDDLDEMEAELKRIAGGSNVIIRVDGFSGGRLPAKSQIASVRIVRSSYDAENHQLGFVFVDIVTKVGASQWSGSLSFNFNVDALNARNAFSEVRFPEQSRNTVFFLDGPLINNKTSVFVLVSDNSGFKAQYINAVLPQGTVNDSVRSNFSTTYFDTGITHNLTKNVPIKLRFISSEETFENLGVGGFNLAARAFATKNQTHEFRFSEAGQLGKTFLNEFRFQFINEAYQTIPQSESTAVIVLDSFSDGGAGNTARTSRQSFRAANNLMFGVKQHAVKIGAEVFFERRKQTSAVNRNGTFIFSTLQDFQFGTPSLFSQNLGVRSVRLSQWQIGAFIQDDVRINESFVLSLGLRYERQTNLEDANNFSPRISFTWSPLKNGKATFRGGIGVFYNWFETDTLGTILSQDINQPGEVVVINPDFPNPFLSPRTEILPKSYWQKAEDAKNPYIIYSSLGIQSQLSRAIQLRAEYIYQKALHQFRSRDLNAPVLGVRPNLDFGRIFQVESSAFLVKNALNVGLSGSLTKNMSFAIDYNLSKTVSDHNGIFGLPVDNYDLRADRSVANNDQRHKIYGSMGWKIRKGLRLTTFFTAASPLPYTITTGRDDNGDTNFNDRPIGTARNSERGAWHRQVDASLSYTFSFIDRESNDSSGSFSVVTTSGDASGSFDFNPKKRFSVRFFATAHNLLNNTNFTNFVGVETSPFFRQATASSPARTIKLGMNFRF
jgi:outer membrane receptor protein involved in Fe transport